MIYDINIKKLDDKAIIPTYGSEYAAGADLYACLDSAVDIEPGQTVLIHTGIAMEIPAGYAGLVYARSGLASKKDWHLQTRLASLMRTTEERSWWLFTIMVHRHSQWSRGRGLPSS